MARYEAGETLASIARTYDCSPPAISYVVSRSRDRSATDISKVAAATEAPAAKLVVSEEPAVDSDSGKNLMAKNGHPSEVTEPVQRDLLQSAAQNDHMSAKAVPAEQSSNERDRAASCGQNSAVRSAAGTGARFGRQARHEWAQRARER